MDRFNDIATLQGRLEVGARLTGGRKNEKGQIDHKSKGRFYITKPYEEEIPGSGGKKFLPLHPRYNQFNSASPTKIRIVLVSASIDETFTAQLKCQKGLGDDPKPDGKMPYCTGDGANAKRWNGSTYEDIPCADSACQYRQGIQKLCKPDVSILFRPVWSSEVSMPTDLMRFDTGSWNTGRNFKGFFDNIRSTAQTIGIKPIVWGLPCILSMRKVKQPPKNGEKYGREFQVVSIQEDGVNIIEHMIQFNEKVASLRDQANYVPPAIQSQSQDVRALESKQEIETRVSSLNPDAPAALAEGEEWETWTD